MTLLYIKRSANVVSRLNSSCLLNVQLSRPFMLAVQTSRRVGQLERALDWVILWLKALGDNITAHMAEPVSLWVKTKIDAARTSEEDLRLRYTQGLMRKGFFFCCCCHVKPLI